MKKFFWLILLAVSFAAAAETDVQTEGGPLVTSDGTKVNSANAPILEEPFSLWEDFFLF